MLPAAASQIWFVALPPFLPSIAAATGVSASVAGQIVGLPLLLAALLIVLVGPLIDVYGHSRVMTVGLAALAVSSLGTAFATDAGILLAVRLVGSFGRAGVIPAAFVDAIGRPSQHQRRHGTGWVVAGAALAPLVGIPALTLVGAHAGWRPVFVLIGVLAALSAMLVWRQARVHPAASTRLSLSSLASVRAALAEPAIATALFSSLLGNAAVWTCLTYLGVLYEVRLGRGVQDVGWALTAIGLGQLAGSLAAMDRRVGLASRPLLASCRVGVGLLFGVTFIAPVGAADMLVLLGGAGILLGVLTSITPLVLTRQRESRRGTVQSLNWFALTAGIAVGASLGGVLLAAGDVAFIGLGTLGLSCLAAMSLVQRGPARPTPAAETGQS